MKDMKSLPMSLDDTLNVSYRLKQMALWREEYDTQYKLLDDRRNQLDLSKKPNLQRDNLIERWQKRLLLTLVKEPLGVSPEVKAQFGDEKIAYKKIREHLANQFAKLSRSDRILWLTNFLFILTPDLRVLLDKITQVREYRSLGQQRNFLLGGASGMGKTSILDYVTLQSVPQVEVAYNHVPIIKLDAPVSDHAKPLLQRMLLECGIVYFQSDTEEELIQKIVSYYHRCKVELVIVDEVEHITRHKIRRRLLEVSNQTHGITYICASCNPDIWTEGDVEVHGRWNDSLRLNEYTGERLAQLLAFLELFLPFSQSSHLPNFTSANSEGIGPAEFVQQKTGGILRDIMILIADASKRAIQQDLPSLSVGVLEEAWKQIQYQPPSVFSEKS